MNASGSVLNSATNGTMLVAPLRDGTAVGSNGNVLLWNQTEKNQILLILGICPVLIIKEQTV